MSGHWEVVVKGSDVGVIAMAMLPVNPGVVIASVTYHEPVLMPSGPPADPQVGEFWNDPTQPDWRRVTLNEESGYVATHVWNGTEWLSLVDPDLPDNLPDDRHSVIED